MDNQQLSDDISKASQWIPALRGEISKVLIGQNELVDRLILGLLCNGHLLLEGLPGLAKTLSIKALSGALGLDFARLQFTPDLLPADLLGTMIYNPAEQNFSAKLGPIFANLILADEINRAPAKVQSALLEAMQERQVTLGDTTYPLPSPFLVLATQNPIDQEGTYTLPEAQLDRFLLKITVDYPTREEELAILDQMANSSATLAPPQTKAIVQLETINASRKLLDSIYIDPAVRNYILDLVSATRHPEKMQRPHSSLQHLIRSGASPRATISLALAARAHAFMQGRSFVTPQDIKDLAPDILRHRILLTFEAEAENTTTDHIIETLLNSVSVP